MSFPRLKSALAHIASPTSRPNRFFGRLTRAAGLAAVAAVLGLIQPPAAQAASPFLVIPEATVAEQSPAYRYANMTNEEAFAELERRQILYNVEPPTYGVRAPIRLTSRLHGVYFHSSLPPEERQTTMFEILDARLALALDDFAEVLERHDIDEVVHYTMYRPNVARPNHADDDGDDHADAKPRKRATKTAEPAAAAPVKPEAAPAKPEAAPTKKKKASPKEAKRSKPSRDKLTKAPKETKGDTAKGDKHKKGAATKKPSEVVEKPKSDKTPTAAPTSPDKTDKTDKAHSTGKRREAQVAKRDKAPKPKAAPAPEPAKPAAPVKPKGTWAPPGTRHPAGLAIDVGMLHKRTGEWLSVSTHFQGNLGDKTCGAEVKTPDSPQARELRSIVCESADLGIFTYVLTPNFNVAHADHYHMEIKPGVRWFLYH